MNIERPGSPSATTVAPTSKRRSTSIETRRSRLASERPPKKGVATRNAFKSGELTAIGLIYARSRHLTAPCRLRLRIAVWTGVTCDTRPFSDTGCAMRHQENVYLCGGDEQSPSTA